MAETNKKLLNKGFYHSVIKQCPAIFKQNSSKIALNQGFSPYFQRKLRKFGPCPPLFSPALLDSDL